VRAPSTDHSQAREVIDGEEADGATDTGDALQVAIDTLAPKGVKSKGLPSSILLLSDGRTTIGRDPVGVARTAGKLHIPIYTISVGTSDALIPNPGFGPPLPVPPDPPGPEPPHPPDEPGPVAPPGPRPPNAGDAAIAGLRFAQATRRCIGARVPRVDFRGLRVAAVRIFVNGRRIRSLTLRTLQRRTLPRVTLEPGRYRVTARVRFQRGSGTPPVRLTRIVRICARPPTARICTACGLGVNPLGAIASSAIGTVRRRGLRVPRTAPPASGR
jgi:hypothetical protein